MDKIRAKRWNSSSNIPETISESGEEKQGWYDPVEACADANVSLCAMMRQLSQTVYILQFTKQTWKFLLNLYKVLR
jgi:hypothetical protein